MEIAGEDVLKIIVSLVIGGLVGFEREYRTKPAGFRTLILICVGSTLFTIMSIKIGGPANPDRIASYILVGIGFIGSGTIYREGLTVSGITTAATIWLTAGLGMAVGDGNYLLAGFVLVVVYVILEIFTNLEMVVDRFHAIQLFKISYKADLEVMEKLEEEFRQICPKMKRINLKRVGNVLVVNYIVEGGKSRFENLRKTLIRHPDIIGFEN